MKDTMISDSNSNLPPQLTPFVGRTQEVEDIIRLIRDPDCRLLTLVGPGGSGKTRLAIETAHRIVDEFADGTCFVSLQSVESAHYLPSIVADAADYPLHGQQDPKQQLFNYLEDRHCLLILDGFEHLLSYAAFPSELLSTAPHLMLLITSRQNLNLHEEWLYQVDGLYVPDQGAPQMDEADAIQLFTASAKRVNRDFALEDEREHVMCICRLVNGLPLAIELAASWLQHLTCAEIATGIARNLDFLETNWRNVPERHRSMRAVFDHSWSLLSDQERTTFMRLTVFPDQFTREAAEVVAQAALDTLIALIEKSMLQRAANGRYQSHSLLRQHGIEQLKQQPDDYFHTQARFIAYVGQFLTARADDMMGGRQIEATEEIAHEQHNVRGAWQWAVEQQQDSFFEQAAQTWSLFCQFKSRYAECAAMLSEALDNLPNTDSQRVTRTRLILQTELGWLYIRLGKLTEARTIAQRCLDRYHTLDVAPVGGHGSDPRLILGVIALIHGDYDRARELGEQAHRVAEQHYHPVNLAFAYYILANAARALGNLTSAENHAERAYRLAEQTGDHWVSAYFLNERGHIARALGNYDTASRHYRASYAIRQEFDDPEGMAVALNYLGELALLQNMPDEARQLFQQSLTIYEKLKDRGGLGQALVGLGAVASANARHQQATDFLRQALEIATEIHYTPLALAAMLRVAQLRFTTGHMRRGCELLSFVLHHPALNQSSKQQAERLRARFGSVEEICLDAPEQKPWEDVAAHLLEELAEPPPLTMLQLPEQDHLIDPLTERELGILRLLAEGLTNQEIADRLTVVVGTVKAHNHSIYGKLGVGNRTEAVARARELNLL